MNVLLLDLSAKFWTAWHATKSQLNSISRVMDQADYFARNYDHVIICADDATNWRYALTADLDKEFQYKASRKKKDPEAVLTLITVEERLEAAGYPVIRCKNYEADDVIATICGHFVDDVDTEIFIASDDKDLYALISDLTFMATTRGVVDAAGCMRKFGVNPWHIRELLAIAGDNSDNIKGCPNVGAGKAADLLNAFGSVHAIKSATFEELTAIKGIGKTIADSVAEWDETLPMQLADMKTDCPIDFDQLFKTDQDFGAPDHKDPEDDELDSLSL